MSNSLFKKYNSFKKYIVGITLALPIFIGVEKVTADTLSTVYHIYVENEYMGTTDNIEGIENLKQSKLEKEKLNYSNFDLTLEEIKIIPEQMFRPVFNNDEAFGHLESNLDVVVASTALKVNGVPIAYINSKEEAEAVVRELKLEFVDEETLKEIELREQNNLANYSLSKGEQKRSKTIDLTFSKPILYEQVEVSPNKVVTVEQAVNTLKKGHLVDGKYIVKENDVLGGIAHKHGLTIQELLDLNPGYKKDTVIKPGDIFNVKVLEPYLTVNEKIDVLEKQTIPFSIEVKEDSSMPKGEQKVVQEGHNGEKLVNYHISKENGREVKREVISESIIKEPVSKIVRKGTKVIPSRGTGSLTWPAVGGYISSELGQRWGRLHKGIDIARPSNRTIKAADNGTVVSAGYDGGYGNKVVINHNNGIKTVYAHLNSITVRVGQVVSQGQKIGIMGSTGNSTGIHLHFEVYENGKLKNPRDYLK